MSYGFHTNFLLTDRFGFKPGVKVTAPDAVCHPFITTVEAISAQTMGFRQQSAICGLTTGLSPSGNIYGIDLLSKLVNFKTRMFPLCPIDDTQWSFETYALDLLSGGTYNGLYANMVLSDGSINGVKGGVGKWFDTGESSVQRGVLIGHYAYIRTEPTPNVDSSLFGNRQGTSFMIAAGTYNSLAGTSYRLSGNNGNEYSGDTSPLLGLHGAQRNSSTTLEYVKNGVVDYNRSSYPIIEPNLTTNLYFHGINNSNGGVLSPSISELAMYIMNVPVLTSQELEVLNYAVQIYQTNVTPLGRNV